MPSRDSQFHGLLRNRFITYLANSFHSIRFGITDAHGKGQVIQFNYLLDNGGIKFDEANGTFSVEFNYMKAAIRKLTNDILTLQAQGSYKKAEVLIDKYGIIRPNLQKALDQLRDVPVDINPVFSFDKTFSR